MAQTVFRPNEINKKNGEVLLKLTHEFAPAVVEEEVKEPEYFFQDWSSLYSWRKQQNDSTSCRHEGWVIEGANGYKVKLKTKFYGFWKMMRTVKDKIIKGQNVKKVFSSEDEVRVYNLLKSKTVEELNNLSIIDIQQEYYLNYPIK